MIDLDSFFKQFIIFKYCQAILIRSKRELATKSFYAIVKKAVTERCYWWRSIYYMNILIYIHNWFNNIFYTLTLSYHTNIYYNMSFSPTKIFLFYKATNIMLKEKREKKNRYNDVIRASITSAPVVRPNREQKARALTHEQTQYSMVVRGGHIFSNNRESKKHDVYVHFGVFIYQDKKFNC